jgi:adenosylcobinamide-GDP ribazoletransferase
MPAPFRDAVPLIARDIVAGVGLLTRLPVPFTAPRPAGAWAWPLVGLGVSGLAVMAGALALAAGLAAPLVAVLVMGVQAALTGALHEDGLADCADGFWGGRDTARRLEIMKDHQIGSYGALALGLAVLARWSALVILISAGHWGVILAAAMLSRVPMAALMAALPNARGSGLAASVGAPPKAAVGMALALALAGSLLLAGWTALPMALAMAGAGLAVALVARAKIGGQTGDVLGAAQVMAEVAALAVAA